MVRAGHWVEGNGGLWIRPTSWSWEAAVLNQSVWCIRQEASNEGNSTSKMEMRFFKQEDPESHTPSFLIGPDSTSKALPKPETE